MKPSALVLFITVFYSAIGSASACTLSFIPPENVRTRSPYISEASYSKISELLEKKRYKVTDPATASTSEALYELKIEGVYGYDAEAGTKAIDKLFTPAQYTVSFKGPGLRVLKNRELVGRAKKLQSKVERQLLEDLDAIPECR
jgi:hypothetical protein